MTDFNPTHWFTEACDELGLGFSLKIRARLHAEQTDFQKIEIFATETFGNLMVIDGFTMLSSRDHFLYHEMMSHPVLYSHALPEQVLIIGGGDCGTLREVLKHAETRRVTQVDIDERVTRLSEQYFPELCSANHDPRATLLFDDGSRFIQTVKAGLFDVIIVDSTDPVGAAKPLFTSTFYADCFKALGKNGIMCQQSASPLLHLQKVIMPMQHNMRAAGFLDVLTIFFPQPIYPGGWWTATLAGKDLALLFAQEQRAEALPFATRYYNAAIHRACQATPAFMWKK